MPFILRKKKKPTKPTRDVAHTFTESLWMRNFKLDLSSRRLSIVLINVKLLLLTEGREYDILYITSFMGCLKGLTGSLLSRAAYMNKGQLLLLFK